MVLGRDTQSQWDEHLSQVILKSCLLITKLWPGQKIIIWITRAQNFVNTGDKVMVLVLEWIFCLYQLNNANHLNGQHFLCLFDNNGRWNCKKATQTIHFVWLQLFKKGIYTLFLLTYMVVLIRALHCVALLSIFSLWCLL